MLAGLLLIELFMISAGLVFRDAVLVGIKDSHTNTSILSQGALPLTGTEDTTVDLTNYPLFLGITGFIIIAGLGGLLYLVFKKDSKDNKRSLAKIFTVLGILVLSGGTILILLSQK